MAEVVRRFGLGLVLVLLGALVLAPLAPQAAAEDVEGDDPLTAKIRHLLRRATFGVRAGDVEKVRAMGIEAWIDRQLEPAVIPDPEVDKRLEDFEKRGINVVSISYDSVEILADFGAKRGIGYPMLADEGSRIIRGFGIFNEREKPGTTGYGIPHPGIVLTDADGVVVATFAERSYRKRPKLDEVLAAIDAAAP